MRLIGVEGRSCCRLSSILIYYLSVIGALLFATIVLEVNTWQFPSFNIQGNNNFTRLKRISQDPPNNNNTSALQCLDLNLNQELDYMISRARLIFVTVPAKAGGTSMNEFTKRCGDTHIREYQDGKPFAFIEKDEYKDLLDKQIGVNSSSIITSHITRDTSLIHLAKRRSNERVLIIYIHREEEERTISGIKMIADHMCKTSVFSDIEMGWYAQSVIAKNKTHCIIDEESILKVSLKNCLAKISTSCLLVVGVTIVNMICILACHSKNICMAYHYCQNY